MRRCLLSVVIIIVLQVIHAGVALADERTYQLDIKSPTLEGALNEFASQSGLQVVYFTKIADGRAAPPLRGSYTAAQALSVLLAATDLRYEQLDERTIAIQSSARQDRSSSLEQRWSSRGDVLLVSAQNDARSLADSRADSPGAVAKEVSDAARSAGADSAIEEITVTAQKRAQRLQDVAMSMQAYSGAQLERMRADDFRDYAITVAGLSFVDQGPGQQQVIIRGLSSGTTVAAGDEPNNRETVGIYIDEVPVSANGFNPDLKLFDVERVEVLRGPQGTLYGGGSMGGAIRTLTKQPNLVAFENASRVTASSTHHGGFNGGVSSMLNLPLADEKFGVRLVGYYRDESGFIDNAALGKNAVNDERTSGGRIAAKWQANEDLSLLLKVLYQEMDLGGFQGSDPGLPKLKQFREVAEPLNDKFTITNLEANYSLPWGSIVSSTSYLDRDLVDHPDLTYLVRDLAPLLGITAVPAGLVNRTDSETFVQEIRAASNADQRLNWILGAFYLSQKKAYGQDLPAPGFDALNDGAAAAFGYPDNLYHSELNFDEKQVAVFGEGSYRLTEQLTATLGLRWFEITQEFDTIAEGLFAANTSGGSKIRIDDLNPKAVLSYKVNQDLMLYVQAAQGFRLGGANDLVPADICAADLEAIGLTEGPPGFGNDSIWNYELGAKSTWLGGRLVMNVAAYHIDWSDIQTTTALPCGFGYKENAGAATVDGVEFELSATPVDGLDVTIGTAYTDTKLTKAVASLGAERGDRLPGVPEFTFAASVRYALPFCRTLACHAQMSYQHTGQSYNTFESNPLAEAQPAYDLGNVTFSIASGKWTLAAFIDNIADERATLFVNQRLNNRTTVNRPRTAGVQVDFHF